MEICKEEGSEVFLFFRFLGAWRSLVARTHGVREVRSSNLLAPTKKAKKETSREVYFVPFRGA